MDYYKATTGCRDFRDSLLEPKHNDHCSIHLRLWKMKITESFGLVFLFHFKQLRYERKLRTFRLGKKNYEQVITKSKFSSVCKYNILFRNQRFGEDTWFKMETKWIVQILIKSSTLFNISIFSSSTYVDTIFVLIQAHEENAYMELDLEATFLV